MSLTAHHVLGRIPEKAYYVGRKVQRNWNLWLSSARVQSREPCCPLCSWRCVFPPPTSRLGFILKDGQLIAAGGSREGSSPQRLCLLPSPPYSPQGTVWSLLEAWKLFDIRCHHVLHDEINSEEVIKAFYSFIL